MKRKIFFLTLAVCLLVSLRLGAQDPSFSQFFASPLNINPALTGNINSQWRAISNLRNQWSGPVYPYITGTFSFDARILKNKIPENSHLGVGVMLLYDKAMGGVLKSNYASVNAAYNIQLAESDNGGIHRLGVGIGGTYSNRNVDYSKLVFGEQFSGFGFDNNLPTGESALSEMKGFFSVNSGILYSYTSDFSNLDIGVAGYHLNKPKQSFLEDGNQVLPIRFVAHANFEHYINDMLVLNANTVFQKQSSTSYFSAGAALGYFLNQDENILVNAGLWYWSNNAIIPYVGFGYKKFQVGITYDITVSKLNAGARYSNSWEIALILRGDNRNTGIIPCPWK